MTLRIIKFMNMARAVLASAHNSQAIIIGFHC